MKDVIFWKNNKLIKGIKMTSYCGSKKIAEYDSSEFFLWTCEKEAKRKCVEAANKNFGVKCTVEVLCEDGEMRELYQTTASPLSAREKINMKSHPFMFR